MALFMSRINARPLLPLIEKFKFASERSARFATPAKSTSAWCSGATIRDFETSKPRAEKNWIFPDKFSKYVNMRDLSEKAVSIGYFISRF